MNRTFSHADIGKLFLTGLCVLLLVGGILDRSALAAQLPPGEYDRIGTAVTPTSGYGYSPLCRRTGLSPTGVLGRYPPCIRFIPSMRELPGLA